MLTLIKFALLLLSALLVTLLVRFALAGTAPAATPATVEKVRFTNGDLPQGLLLREEDMTWKSIPIAKAPANAVVFGATGAVEFKGSLLRHPMTSGALLSADDVILPGSSGFLAASLKPEMRAVSVAVDDVSGNAGLIQPGDYVDLLLTQQMGNRTNSPGMSVSSETIVDHVRVLAVGSEIIRPKAGDTPDANNRVRTVTLEVTPHMGEAISVAAHLGSLSLALRSFATVTRDPGAPAPATSQSAPVWAGEISRAVRDLSKATPTRFATQAAAPAAPAVIVYRGSSEGEPSSSPTPTGSMTGNDAPPLPQLATLR